MPRAILVHLNVEIADEDDDEATPDEIGAAIVGAIQDASPPRTFAKGIEVVLAEEI